MNWIQLHFQILVIEHIMALLIEFVILTILGLVGLGLFIQAVLDERKRRNAKRSHK